MPVAGPVLVPVAVGAQQTRISPAEALLPRKAVIREIGSLAI